MSQGCEWQRGSAGCRSRLEEEGVLQAEVGDGDRAGCSMLEQPYVRAEAGEGRGGRSTTEAFWICTGEREKRRCSNEWEIRGAGEEEQEEGEAKEAEQAPFNLSQGSHGKLHGSGESEDSAKLKKVGLEDEFRDEEVKEELGPQSGKELAPEPELDAPPPWLPRLTGVQTLDALGCQVERHRDRSSGTERDRQWRFGGGGGGELWKASPVKDTSGLWIVSPEWEGGHRESGPQESSRRFALDDGCVAELVSKNAK